MTDHPITPPPELVQQWCSAALGAKDWLGGYDLELIATQAARWGADQELEACCEAISQVWEMDHVSTERDVLREVRAIRRPKPPTLAERALDAQRRMWDGGSSHADWELIRAALERLQELEGANG